MDKYTLKCTFGIRFLIISYLIPNNIFDKLASEFH